MSRYTNEFKEAMLQKLEQGNSIEDIVKEGQSQYPYFNEKTLKKWTSVKQEEKEESVKEPEDKPQSEVLPKKRGPKPYLQEARAKAVEMKKIKMTMEQIKEELSKEFPRLNLDKVDEWLEPKKTKKMKRGRKPFLQAAEKSIRKMKKENLPVLEIKQRAAKEFPNLSVKRMNEFIGDYEAEKPKTIGRKPLTVEQKMQYRMSVIEGLEQSHIDEMVIFFENNCTVDAICRYMEKQHGLHISAYDVKQIGNAYGLKKDKRGMYVGAIEEITLKKDGTYAYMEKYDKGKRSFTRAAEVDEKLYNDAVRHIQIGNLTAARQLLQERRGQFSGQRIKTRQRLMELHEALQEGLQDDNSITIFYDKVTRQLLEDGKTDDARQILEEKVQSINTKQFDDQANLAYSNLCARLKYINQRYPKKSNKPKEQVSQTEVPGDSTSCLRLVHDYMMSGNYQEAKRLIKTARQLLPNKDDNRENYQNIVNNIDFYEKKLWEAVSFAGGLPALVDFENDDMPEISNERLAELQENILLNRLPMAQRILSTIPPEERKGMEYNLVRAQLYFGAGKIQAVQDMKNRLAPAKGSKDRRDKQFYSGIARLAKIGKVLDLDKKVEKQDKMQ